MHGLLQWVLALLFPIRPIRVDPGCRCPHQARAAHIHLPTCVIR